MRLWIDWLANLISSSSLTGSFKETSTCSNIINTYIYYLLYCKYPLGIDRDIDRDSIENEISTRDSIPLEEQKKYLMNLLKKDLLKFRI